MAVSSTEHLLEGLRLVGNVVRFNHMPPGSGRLCLRVCTNGMVEIEGFPGQFAPFMFVIDGEVAAVPVLGWVN